MLDVHKTMASATIIKTLRTVYDEYLVRIL